jgi:oligoribonuclease
LVDFSPCSNNPEQTDRMQGIFLDIETTGLNSLRHAPVDIALRIVDLSTYQSIGSYQSIISLSSEAWEKRDPMSVEINGFTWEKTLKGKSPDIVGKEIITLFTSLGIQRGSSVFICQNPAFDRGFFNQMVDVYVQELLNWPYHWLDLASMFWAMHVARLNKEGKNLPDRILLSKNEIARVYGIAAEPTPHQAMGGVDHLIECYRAVLGR